MKHTLFMVALTLLGTFGALRRPALGVIIYYFFAVLRPQYIWQWDMPEGVTWSQYVAPATIIGAYFNPGKAGNSREKKWTAGALEHDALRGQYRPQLYLRAIREVGYYVFVNYLKIFVMFAVSSIVIRKTTELWALYLVTAGSLAYIAYEVNFLYFVNGYLGIQQQRLLRARQQRGRPDAGNGDAPVHLRLGGPVLAVALDLPGLTPPIIHAVMMTYSRGAMLSMIVATPLMIIRSRYRVRFGVGVAAFAFFALPIMAGPEIESRFMSINDADDGIAQSRRQSWAAGWAIAKDYPLFGVGIRNSNYYTFKYGADVEGRTIHDQYIQIAADSGFRGPGVLCADARASGLERPEGPPLRGQDRRGRGEANPGDGLGDGVRAGGLLFRSYLPVAGSLRTPLHSDIPGHAVACGRREPALGDRGRRGLRSGDRAMTKLERSPVPAAVQARVSRGGGPIRVAFVVHVMQVAGAEMLVSETIRATSGEVEPTVICLDAVGTLGEQLRSDGVEVACLGRRPGRDLRAAGRMAGVIRRRRIERWSMPTSTPRSSIRPWVPACRGGGLGSSSPSTAATSPTSSPP